MKTINILSCLFVAVIACMGCSKEHDNEVIEATGTHTVTFMAQKEIETRTYVVEGEDNASYYWDLNDNQYFYIYENGILPISREMILSEGGKVASFRATFRDTDATSFTYSAIYARDITSSGDVCVPNYQYPPHLSFDPEADVLVSAETVSLKDGVRLDKDTTIQFKMKRLASVNKITVKGINPGEKVVGVALYADQPLGGYFCYDGEGTRFDLQKELFLDLYNWDEADRVVGADGSLSVYFLSLPITRASTTVRVWTEKTMTVTVEQAQLGYGLEKTTYTWNIKYGIRTEEGAVKDTIVTIVQKTNYDGYPDGHDNPSARFLVPANCESRFVSVTLNATFSGYIGNALFLAANKSGNLSVSY